MTIRRFTLACTILALSLVLSAPVWSLPSGPIDDLTPSRSEGKPDPALRIPASYERATPGPDRFGYTYHASPSTPLPAEGDALPLALAGDDEAAVLDLGFDFPFYGQRHQKLWVSTNGYLSFNGPETASTWLNRPPPDAANPAGMIAPFWDDLLVDPAAGDAVRAQALPEALLVDWTARSYRQPEATYRFQAVLHADGSIAFHYLAMNGPTSSATVGIQAPEATAGLGYLFNGYPEANGLYDGLSVRFEVPQGLLVWPGYQRGTAQAGEQVRFPIALINQTGANGSFALSIQDAWPATVEPARLSVAAGASADAFVWLQVPDAAPGTRHTLRVAARQVDGPAEAQTELELLVNSGLYGYAGASLTDEAAVWDMTTNVIIERLSLLPEGNYPYDATMTPDGAEVWIPGASGDGVVVINTTTNTITHRIAVGDYPINVTFRADSAYAFVANRDTEDITVVDASTYGVVDSIPVPTQYLGPGNMALNPVSGEIYVVDWYDNRFWVLDPVAMQLTQEVPLGVSLWQLVVSPTGDRLYITDRGTDSVHVLDTGTLTEIGTIPVGDDPWGIDITPDGVLLYITNEDSHDVTVADAVTYGVITTIDLPQPDDDPRDVDVSIDGSLAYIPSGDISGPDQIYVVDTGSHTVVSQVDVSPASNPNVVAVAPQMAGAIAAFHVDDISLRYGVRSWPPEDLLYKVWARVRVVDEGGEPVDGAEVFVEWERPDGALRQRSALTNSSGHAFLRTASRQIGIYTVTVTNIQKPGWTYDPDANNETSDQIQIP